MKSSLAKHSAYIVKYAFVGVVNTLVCYAIIFLLMLARVSPEVSNFCGYLVGILLSYALNKRFTFKSSGTHSKEAPRFFASMGISYTLNIVVLAICIHAFNVNPYVAQFIAGIFYFLSGFTLSRFWAFNVREVI